MVYRSEYADHLRAWPKAVVVTSCLLPPPEIRREDDMLAVDWANWASAALVDAFLEPLLRD